MSFLKNIWKTSSKHKKLSEEWALAKNNREIDIELTDPNEDATENEEPTFKLKYLGSTPVDIASSEAVTAEAIKTIIRVAKASGKKLPRVTVTVTLKGIKISGDQDAKDNEISIYRISYCSADAAHNRVFAFIAANTNETMECHAFLASKRKMAQAVTLAVARAFSMAYEAWRVMPSSAEKEKRPPTPETPEVSEKEPLPQLIDLDDFNENDIPIRHQPKINNDVTKAVPRPRGLIKTEWVSFAEDDEALRWANDQTIDLILS